ncbi:MAG TPA: calcium-binding protein [Microvirga sp.]|jgi:Ca2+-binding RTX toxin-like protein|nr:calcium-binding protein [Microvirga sp.]
MIRLGVGGVIMADRRVPGDYRTLAKAIAAAAEGDTIVVGPGYAGAETRVEVGTDDLTISLNVAVPDLRIRLAPALGDADLTLAGGGAAQIRGNAGANRLVGNDGDNVLRGGGGSDALDGGGGLDWADYGNAPGPVTVDIDAGIATGAAGSDTLAGIESIRGSAFGDTLLGDESDNSLRGRAGDDLIDGRTGFDYVDYIEAEAAVTVDLARSIATGASEGTDTLLNIENVRGSHHDDVLFGTGVENRFRGLGGDDEIHGGGGLDYIDYRDATAFVVVDLARATGTGRSEGADTLISIEKVIGSAFDDTLTGSRDDNLLRGVGGSDTLAGGRGHDSFVFSLPSEGGARGDRIVDFASAKAVKADPGLAGDAILIDASGFGVGEGDLAAAGVAFVTDGPATRSKAALVYDSATHTLSWDADGSGAGAPVVLAVFENGAALSRADFGFI